MIIKRILLDNIRSYSKPAPIELGTGVTLFEGDIGSGKSTILSAIEFALFGIGDVTGEYLLRHGATLGSVTIEFSVNNSEYKVFRSLEWVKKKAGSKKGKSVQQVQGYIVEDGERKDYGVTEMKIRILQILQFNEKPQANTGSLIYRYAVFTPQEMMKDVLNQKVENRLDTLRRAFRIEDYNTIANNASILNGWLKNESKLLERQTKDIDEKRKELEEIRKSKGKDLVALQKLSSELNALSEKRIAIAGEIEANQTKKDQLTKILAELPLMKAEIQQTSNTLAERKKRLSTVKDELIGVSIAEKALNEIIPLYEEYERKNKRIDELELSVQENQKLSSQKEKLSIHIENAKNKILNENAGYVKDLEGINRKIKKQETATARMPELLVLANQLATEIANAPKYSDLIISLKQQYSTIIQDSKNKRERVSVLEDELKSLRGIGIGAPCPKCKQELTQLHYGKVQQEYLKEIGELTSKITVNNDKALETNKQINKVSEKQKAFTETENKLNETRQTLAKLGEAKEALESYQNEFSEKQALYQSNQKLLSEEKYALSEKQKLAEVIAQLEKLAPFEKEYNENKSRAKQLEKLKVKEQFSSNKEKIGRKGSLDAELSIMESTIAETEHLVLTKQKAIELKQEEYEVRKPILQVLKDLATKESIIQREYDNKNGELSGMQKEIENATKEITRLEGEIAAREHQKLRSDELKQHSLWLEEHLIPAIKIIEKNVLNNINTEFNTLFINWFNHLLETGDITVRVNESFTPLIEQSGYEMDVSCLSGGEKTSVALAYRLALNVMVKKVCDAMQSNLLILDEPTDGFSREQLFRLRDILKELNCEQVIMVSHENELEGFVDKIHRITKEAGESKITTM